MQDETSTATRIAVKGERESNQDACASEGLEAEKRLECMGMR